MKVGNVIDGLAVVDVKRINKMNLIQFTKAVSEYIEKGYKLDVHSSRQVGLVLYVDVFKTEELKSSEGEIPPVVVTEAVEDQPDTVTVEVKSELSEAPAKKVRTKKLAE